MYRQLHYFGLFLFILSVIYVAKSVLRHLFEDESSQVDEWLDQNDLGDYKKLFKEHGELFTFLNNHVYVTRVPSIVIQLKEKNIYKNIAKRTP